MPFRSLFVLLAMLGNVARADVVVEDAWVRGLPPGVANASAYMTLRNTGDSDVTLTGASAPIAGSVVLHGTMNHGGMLHMTHIESVTVPANGSVKLETGGTHLMLMELKQVPVPGEVVELTLEFGNGSTQMLELPVRSVLDE